MVRMASNHIPECELSRFRVGMEVAARFGRIRRGWMLSQRAFGMGRRGNHRVWLASAVCGRSVAESGVVQCPPRTYLRLTPPGFGSPIVRSYPGTAPMDRVFCTLSSARY